MLIIPYDGTEEHMNSIASQKKSEGYRLKEVQNITEGNFLGFMDTQPQIEIIQVEEPVTNSQLEELQSQNLILMDALATLYETVLGGTL